MNDITLMDLLYTGGILFLIFYGSIFFTKFLAGDESEASSEGEPSTEETEPTSQTKDKNEKI